MLLNMLKSKIHRVTITDARLHYQGSLTVPGHLLEKARILPGEKVLVVNITNGARLETYTQLGDDPKRICLNGAAARLGQPGDIAIVICFALMSEDEARAFEPTIVFMGADNEVESIQGPKDA